MPQDRDSGAQAAEWGKATARQIAVRLGATNLRDRSNECTLNGRPVTIKCAAPKTIYVGVTYLTLKRIEAVVGAFQADDGSFDLWEMAAADFTRMMRDAAGSGTG